MNTKIKGNNTGSLDELLSQLVKVAHKGPIRAVRKGATGVGMTLLNELGITNSSMQRARYDGIVVKARRVGKRTTGGNRVNLFAQVADWSISECESSREIVQRHGYDCDDGARRLNCTIDALGANSQGLKFRINKVDDILEEWCVRDGVDTPVASWKMERLRQRLEASLPASVWVMAEASMRGGEEYFHYRECVYTEPACSSELGLLLESGTVTMDHLIELKNGRSCEKGPLFKIKPSNFDLLFPPSVKYDLLSI